MKTHTFILHLFILLPSLAISANTSSYVYDSSHRIIKVTNSHVQDYIYDKMGNRLVKTTSSSVFSFNTPPGNISGEVVLEANNEQLPRFEWTESNDADGDKVTYSLLLGTSENSMHSIYSGFVTHYTLQHCLQPETNYYWQVVAKDSKNVTTESAISRFTTPMAYQPSLQSDVKINQEEGVCNNLNYFLLEIDEPFDIDVSVSYKTRNGTAKAGEDFIYTTGIATIKKGEVNTLIPVMLMGDRVLENDEYFYLVISDPQGASFPQGVTEFKSKHMIVDDDLDLMTGTWKGETSTGNYWDVVINISEGMVGSVLGTAYQTTFDCMGELTLISIAENTLTFKQNITSGNCTDNLYVDLSYKTMNQLYYREYYSSGSTIGAGYVYKQ